MIYNYVYQIIAHFSIHLNSNTATCITALLCTLSLFKEGGRGILDVAKRLLV